MCGFFSFDYDMICVQKYSRKKRYNMKLIVGLGNPGKQYENTRHNAGFLAIDKVAEKLGVSFQVSKFRGLLAQTRINGEQVLLLKPQTFMNLSGESVIQVMNYYRLEPKDLIVMFDDKDTEVGDIRLRPQGSAGGQNGVKSIIQHVGTQVFNRIRIGIGSPGHMNMAEYVLGQIDKQAKEQFDSALEKAAQAAIDSASVSFQDVMTKYNTKPENVKKAKEKKDDADHA